MAIIISRAPIPAPIINKLLTFLGVSFFVFLSILSLLLLKIERPANLYITNTPAVKIPDNTFSRIFKY